MALQHLLNSCGSRPPQLYSHSMLTSLSSSVAASSPNSLGSDAMDESDSDRDDEPPARDSQVPYPLEGKYRDARDRAYIEGLSQLEREEILGQRAEEMSKTKFHEQLARLAAQNNSKKRKADSEEPEDPRKSSRSVKPRVNEKLEAYKQAREQRGQQRDRYNDGRDRRRRSSSASRRGGSDIDADGESDVEYDDRKAATREEPPATISHFDSVRVSRGFFSGICFYPGFEEAMTGTFGRIGVGQDAQRRTLYKMAQIKGFTVGKPYVFEGKNGKRIATDQYAICQHGTVKKEYQFQFLSNQRFTEMDLDIYKQSLVEAGAKIPTQSFLKKKYDDIKALENRFWTDEDINARIAKTNKYSYLLNKQSSSEPAPRIPTESQAAAARLAEINRQSKRAELERIMAAQKEEKRQKLRARKIAEKKAAAEEAAKKAQEEAAVKKGHLEVDALFDGGDSSRASTPKPQEKKKTERKGLPTFRKPKMDDDIIASMDIGLDIEI
ncbi:plus-3-domain-containing protein [Byssothecium circinans]|uniref:Plus-3-domain-containing protein n=1 Tax=Byssothecium circinans TaxID=147558 RepID=A0A6A5TWY2_9PLEO|nr:plus-3-domain-containing protein [Byssothecium circinans]